MTISNITFIAILLNLWCMNARGQSTEAQRYIDRQGVDMIQNRGSHASEERTSAKITLRKPQLEIEHAMFYVAASDQAARDRDRLAILQFELQKELEKVREISRTLAIPIMRASLAKEAIVQMEDNLREHEQNIKSLNAEIKRVR